MDPSEVTILVVEDDEFTRIATVEILVNCNYSVDSAQNGKEALEMLLEYEGRFDLVLCDVMLPIMNGMELLDELSKNDHLRCLPVVMTSSNEEMETVTTCLSKGAKDYLIKPIQVNTAKTLVRHVWLCRRTDPSMNEKPVWRDFDVIRPIGKGTHGTVVLARRKRDGAVVGLKQIQTELISENARKQAANEVLLLKSLYHVNIVRFYDSFMEAGVLNIVMEYADGGNLRQLVKLQVRKQLGSFTEERIMSWFAQLVLAVAYIHGKNVLHRDLKAQNVFLTKKNVVKLGDFGISKALTDDVLASTACGTPESMSPEICRGEPYGKKSDIWSLGCVLYEMMMLRRPFEAPSLPDMFTRICRGNYDMIPDTFSRELRLLIQLMLQQDPAKRPSIEDIYRFPFVQAPIQTFLHDHVAEFQEALEQEAKLHQLQPQDSEGLETTLTSSIPPVNRPDRADSIRNTAMLSTVVGMRPNEYNGSIIEENENEQADLGTQDWRDQVGEDLRKKVKIGNRRTGFLTQHSNCVTAAELMLPLKNEGKSHEESMRILKDLVDGDVLHIVTAGESPVRMDSQRTLVRFRVDEADQPLNRVRIWRGAQRSTMDICISLRSQMADLHMKSSYPNLKGTEQYLRVVHASSEVQAADILALPKPDRQSFFINMYNTMVLHGFVELGIPETSEQYKSFEKNVKYDIGGNIFSLGDIRHGILRCNRKPPSSFWGKQFDIGDPRIKMMLHIRDPRCLLALIESCAPIPLPEHVLIFRPGSTDTALEKEVEQYCRQNISFEIAMREIALPKLFRTYRDDFGTSESEVISWLQPYLPNCPVDIASYRVRYGHSISN